MRQGGGAFVQDKTRALLQEKSTSIWLDAPLDVLIERVQLRPNKRPLLQHDNVEDIMRRLMEQRQPYYQQAALHIPSHRWKHHKVVDAILLAMTE